MTDAQTAEQIAESIVTAIFARQDEPDSRPGAHEDAVKAITAALTTTRQAADSRLDEARKAALEEAVKWHNKRAIDTPDAFEMEFHQASVHGIRALFSSPAPQGRQTDFADGMLPLYPNPMPDMRKRIAAWVREAPIPGHFATLIADGIEQKLDETMPNYRLASSPAPDAP